MLLMNYTINKLEWESDFFNMNIAEIDLLKVKSNYLINQEHSYDLIILKNNNYCTKINGYTKSFEELKITYYKKLKLEKSIINDIRVLDTDTTPINPKKLYNLAYLSGRESRFKLDKNFNLNHFKKLYKTWINNSIDKSFGFKVFYIVNKDTPIAFVTLNKKEKEGQIGLIAVNEDYQGQGLGKLLINHVETFCVINGINTLTIPTQHTNTSAMTFYKKLGYNINEELKIEHYWKNHI